MLRTFFLSLLSTMVIGTIGAVTPAFALHEWAPVGGVPDAVSTNLIFKVSALEDTCAVATGVGGSIASKSTEWTIKTPVFLKCLFKVVKVVANWKVIDDSTTEATLVLPANAVEIEVTGTCLATLSPGKTTNVVGEWENGINALTEPSSWAFTKKLVEMSSTNNCLESTLGEINGVYSVSNVASGATEPIKAT